MSKCNQDRTLREAGLKVTRPRVKILKMMQEPSSQHSSVEDIYKKLLEQGEEIGLATVYRVLNQFNDAGIVTRHHFESGKSVFELTSQEHHDHLVCLDCDKVIEFKDDTIEQRQCDIAKRYHMQLTDHHLSLYGHCTNKHCAYKK